MDWIAWGGDMELYSAMPLLLPFQRIFLVFFVSILLLARSDFT